MHTFLLLLVSVIWGSTFFIIKDTVGTVNELVIVFGRSALAAIFMLLLMLVKNPKSLINKNAVFHGSIIGILLASTYLSQTIGLKFTSSGHSAFVTSSGVIFVPVILFIFFKERFGKSIILALGLVITGLFLLTYDFETKINIGDLITFITAVSYAFHIVLSGKFVKKTEAFALITYQFIAASLFILIVMKLKGIPIQIEGNAAKYSIVYLGLIGTLVCYFISVWIQQYVSALKVAIIFTLEPIFASLFGYFAHNEELNQRGYLGAAFIIGGIIFYETYKYKSAKMKEKLRLKEESVKKNVHIYDSEV